MHGLNAEQVRRQPRTLQNILEILEPQNRSNVSDTILQEIIDDLNSTPLLIRTEPVVLLKILLSVLTVANDNYKNEREQQEGLPSRDRRSVYPPLNFYYKVNQLLEKISQTYGQPFRNFVLSLHSILTDGPPESIQMPHNPVIKDSRAGENALRDLPAQFAQLLQTDEITTETKNIIKALFTHTLIQTMHGYYNYYSSGYNFSIAQKPWALLSFEMQLTLLESVNKTIRENEFKFDSDGGRDSWGKVRLNIDGFKKNIALFFTKYLSTLPLYELCNIQVRNLVHIFTASFPLLQLECISYVAKEEILDRLVGTQAINNILSTLRDNKESGDADIKAQTLITLMRFYENFDLNLLDSLKRSIETIRVNQPQKIYTLLKERFNCLLNILNIPEGKFFIFDDISAALDSEYPEVLKAAIAFLTKQKNTLGEHSTRIIEILASVIKKFDVQKDNRNMRAVLPLLTELQGLKTQFETIHASLNPRPVFHPAAFGQQPNFFPGNGLGPNPLGFQPHVNAPAPHLFGFGVAPAHTTQVTKTPQAGLLGFGLAPTNPTLPSNTSQPPFSFAPSK